MKYDDLKKQMSDHSIQFFLKEGSTTKGGHTTYPGWNAKSDSCLIPLWMEAKDVKEFKAKVLACPRARLTKFASEFMGEMDDKLTLAQMGKFVEVGHTNSRLMMGNKTFKTLLCLPDDKHPLRGVNLVNKPFNTYLFKFVSTIEGDVCIYNDDNEIIFSTGGTFDIYHSRGYVIFSRSECGLTDY